MTCVVSIRKDGKLVIGADKLVTSGSYKLSNYACKIIKKRDDLLVAFSGMMSVETYLRYEWDLTDIESVNEKDDKLILSKIVSSLRSLLSEETFQDDRGFGVLFIIYKAKTYFVDKSFCCVELSDIEAIGSGEEIAVGAMCALYNLDYSAKEIAYKALSIASDRYGDVGCVFDLVEIDLETGNIDWDCNYK